MKIESIPADYPLGLDFLSSFNIKGLNIGCGADAFAVYNNTEYMYTDIHGFRSEFLSEKAILFLISGKFLYLKHDATNTYPFQNEIFSWIYLEHFIEHIYPAQFLCLLLELKRLLKKGGVIRLSTPDLNKYIEGYMEPDKSFFRKQKQNAIKAFFPDTLYSFDNEILKKEIETRSNFIKKIDPDVDTDGKEKTVIIDNLIKSVKAYLTRPAAMINQLFYAYGHKYIYDFNEISFWAKKAGFSDNEITLLSFRKGKDKGLYSLDLDFRRHESIYIELYKL